MFPQRRDQVNGWMLRLLGKGGFSYQALERAFIANPPFEVVRSSPRIYAEELATALMKCWLPVPTLWGPVRPDVDPGIRLRLSFVCFEVYWFMVPLSPLVFAKNFEAFRLGPSRVLGCIYLFHASDTGTVQGYAAWPCIFCSHRLILHGTL
jgi:hypothetical protein